MRHDVLVVFVRAPLAGRVKTRLAAGLGPERAVALYRDLGRRIVARCTRPREHRTVIWYAPPRKAAVVKDWLGDLPVDRFHAQRGVGLGARLAGAFAHHLAAGAGRVAVIGSDCPGVDHRLVGRAFAALARHDLVLGPAHDGGYYLIALSAPAPGLFRAVDWSTAQVLEQTLASARTLGMSAALLPVLRDVDTVADARALHLVAP